MISMIQYSDITSLIHQALSASLSPVATQITEIILSALLAFIVMIVCVIIMVYMERKVAGFMQMRLGPNRVGPFGTFQVFADVLKLLLKESFTPNSADKFMFNLAPCIVLMVTLMALAPISWGPGLVMWDSNIGILFITAITSLSVIGILMAGWSSNNKYSLLGAMRSGAQIVSYELSAGLAIVTAVILSGTISSVGMVESQADGWWILKGHIPAMIAFLTYVISSTAECNRAPFDLAEAESELTAGYHTEYSGMKFGIFYLNEYINMGVVSIVASTLFLGGWMPLHLPFNNEYIQLFNHLMDFIPSWIWLFGKMFMIIFFMMWFRWTLPRLRIDQLLKLEWKYLLPINICNLILATAISIFGWHL